MKSIKSTFEFKLKDGTRVLLRPIRPSDKKRLRQGLKMMSEASRYLRFFSPIVQLTEKQLHEFTEVDQYNHVAWIALDPVNLDFPGYGVGRFVRIHENHTTAEMAFAVIDEYQRRGVGTVLLCVLYLVARNVGVKVLQGRLLPENKHLTDWLEDLGATYYYDSGSFQINLPVLDDLEKLPETRRGKIFKELLDQLLIKMFNE